MTNFLDANRASSKASRNARKQVARPVASSATERAVASLRLAVGKDIKKSDAKERRTMTAMCDTLPDVVAALSEEALAAFFFAFERLAKPTNRRHIAEHPLRPQIVDEMHAEADEEDALAAEEAEREAAAAVAEADAAAAEADPADAVADAGKASKATPKGALPDGASPS